LAADVRVPDERLKVLGWMLGDALGSAVSVLKGALPIVLLGVTPTVPVRVAVAVAANDVEVGVGVSVAGMAVRVGIGVAEAGRDVMVNVGMGVGGTGVKVGVLGRAVFVGCDSGLGVAVRTISQPTWMLARSRRS
jgi:hypothetical protein